MAGHFPVAAFIALCLPQLSAALPNGAPVSACEDMEPVHTGVEPQTGPAPYTFTLSSSSFRNGQAISVQIMGPDYRGLLLQARTFASPTPLGSWINPPNNTKNLLCPLNVRGAITHANTNVKTNSTTYTWLPPDSNCPNVIMFKATIAQARAIYWLNVQSAVLWKDATATCRSVNSGSSGLQTITWTSSVLLLLAAHLLLLCKGLH
ncbi:putative defense protein Hdd11-like [Ambystoma mexicanum]|uniref:putative defense protein Hdd11-like n=1 Tax=Ambystoma mexicanum TaxID=8296 RepID=UPI0037E6F7CD